MTGRRYDSSAASDRTSGDRLRAGLTSVPEFCYWALEMQPSATMATRFGGTSSERAPVLAAQRPTRAERTGPSAARTPFQLSGIHSRTRVLPSTRRVVCRGVAIIGVSLLLLVAQALRGDERLPSANGNDLNCQFAVGNAQYISDLVTALLLSIIYYVVQNFQKYTFLLPPPY